MGAGLLIRMGSRSCIAFFASVTALVSSVGTVGAASPAAAQPVRLANISTRLAVGTADSVLIAGFIVTGSQPKRILLRGLGPSLPVNENLTDPTLELHD